MRFVLLLFTILTAALGNRRDFSQTHFITVFKDPSHIRIVGGTEAVPHSAPYQVGIWINGNAFCGGALISPNYVLTAGHCGYRIRRAEVTLGAHNISNSDEITQISVNVSKVILHPQYEDEGLSNDIALLELVDNVTLNEVVQIVSLPKSSKESYVNQTARATGWGLISDTKRPTLKDMSDVLQSVDVSVIDLELCKTYFNDEEHEDVGKNHVCTSGYKGRGTCDGDSGGPLVVDGILIGVTSFGSTQCETCAPSVYANVASYLDWIIDNSNVEFS